MQRRSHYPHSLPLIIPALFWLFISLTACEREEVPTVQPSESSVAPPEPVELVPEYPTYSKFPGHFSESSLEPWKEAVPDIREVRITSGMDGSPQPALFYDPPTREPRPLLVTLHSWSSDYLQAISIPYAVWALRNEWVFIHPDYRGAYNRPEATASEPAVQDIVDAVAYAKAHAEVDTARVYLVGFSGGAMTALVMAGRYPELWTAVAAWVPVYDLVDWYPYVTQYPERHYEEHIEASCGGAPLPGTEAAEECRRRSPSTYLANARGKDVEVFIATGIDDDYVPPDHSLRAFNLLADPEDRFSPEIMADIVKNRRIPPALAGDYTDSLYAAAGTPLLYSRSSGNAVLNIFESGHDVVYNAGLAWLSRQR